MTFSKQQFFASAGALALLAACGSKEPATTAPAEAPAHPVADERLVHPEIWPKGTYPIARDPEMEARIAAIVAEMTIEEKVGQIIQPDISAITPEEVGEYHIGSVLNGGNSAPDGDLRAHPSKWVELADAYWEASVGPDGDGIPMIWGTDAVHGHTAIVGATVFPHNIGLGAMDDAELIEKIGAITALEMTITGLDWTFSPTVATPRNDRWGRTYEGYSEDPRIVADYASAYVYGLQGIPGTDGFLGAGKVIATAKHFVGDGGTKDGIDQGETEATEEELRDIHAAGYVPAIEAGLQTAMASFSSWQGQKMHGRYDLLNDVLVDQMGLDGFVVGDWNGHAQVKGCTPTDCPQSLNAGVDMYMAPDTWKGLFENTVEAVHTGEITMERLDEAVTRILRVKMRAAIFEKGRPSERPFTGQFELLGSPEHRAVAREAARKSLVMLKNDGVLPLKPGQTVLVTGDGADNMGKQTGGWTLSWQGDGNSRADFPNGDTIWEGLNAAITETGGTAILSEDGQYDQTPDVAVVVFGEDPYAEMRGDRPSVDFTPEGPLKTMQALQADGIPVVAVFLSGRPMWVNPELNATNAFVAAWLPGSEGGAIADLFVADAEGAPRYDFSGRLSFSWPKRPDQVKLNVGEEGYDPLFAYGFGLTYEDDGALDVLPVDYETSADDPSVFIADGQAKNGRILMISSAGADVTVEDATGSTANGALTLSRTDRNAQEDSIKLVWSGEAPATFALKGEAVDLMRESNADIGLTVTYRVDEISSASLSYGLGGAAFTLPADMVGSFQTVSTPLKCFAAKGADLTAVTDAFTLSAEGNVSVTIHTVTLTPSAGGVTCPTE